MSFPNSDCICRSVGVDLEGVKLDIVIIQKNLETVNETLLSFLSKQSLVHENYEEFAKWQSNFVALLNEKNRMIDQQNKLFIRSRKS